MKALTSIGYRRSGSPRCHRKSRLVRSSFVVECCPEPGLDILGVLVARALLVDWNTLICRSELPVTTLCRVRKHQVIRLSLASTRDKYVLPCQR